MFKIIFYKNVNKDLKSKSKILKNIINVRESIIPISIYETITVSRLIVKTNVFPTM